MGSPDTLTTPTVPTRMGVTAPQASFWKVQLRRWLPRLILCCAFGHFICSAWPFAPVEGDDQAVVNGLMAWGHQWQNHRELSYLFAVQPGSFFLLRQIMKLSGCDAFSVYGAVSATGGVLFWIFGSTLLKELTGVRWVWSALLLLSVQEISAAWSYANTSTIAGCVMLAGILIASRSVQWPRLLGGGVLIGLAGTLRLDALLIAPVVWPILAHRFGEWKLTAWATSKVAVVSAAVILAIYFWRDVSFREAWALYGSRGVAPSWAPVIKLLPITLSYAIMAAAIVGLATYIRKLDTTHLAIVFAGVAPSLIAYGPNFTTTKYFYYAVPFAVFPALAWLRQVALHPQQSGRRLFHIWLALALLETFVGVRTTAAYWRRFVPSSAWFDIVSFHEGNVGAIATLGSGEILGTADGFRFRTGTWYAYSIWKREKRAMLAEIALLRSLHLQALGGTILTSNYLSDVVLSGECIRDGLPPVLLETPFPKNPATRSILWSNGRVLSKVLLIAETQADAAEVLQATKDFSPSYFVSDRGRGNAHHLGLTEPKWTCLSPNEEGLLTIYRRNSISP